MWLQFAIGPNILQKAIQENLLDAYQIMGKWIQDNVGLLGGDNELSLVWPVHLKSLLNHVADCKSQSTISLSAEATGESPSNTRWATWSLPEGRKATPSTLYGMNNALCCSVEELFLWVCEHQSAECSVQDFFPPSQLPLKTHIHGSTLAKSWTLVVLSFFVNTPTGRNITWFWRQEASHARTPLDRPLILNSLDNHCVLSVTA